MARPRSVVFSGFTGFLNYVGSKIFFFHSTQIESLGETRIIILILLLIIIISAGTTLVSYSFHLSWNPKYIEFWDQYILVSS